MPRRGRSRWQPATPRRTPPLLIKPFNLRKHGRYSVFKVDDQRLLFLVTKIGVNKEILEMYSIRIQKASRILALIINLTCLPLILLTSAHAQQTADRFALLVGVDDYLQPSNKQYRINPLKGPGNDIEMMRDLLITYHFPNDSAHILMLPGKRATHSGIRQAFKTQLIDNAVRHPGSLVVFYFSGHGSQMRLKAGDTSLHDTLVAYDSRADIKAAAQDQGFDIVDNELANWLEDLRAHTNNIVIILDSCHSGDAIKDITLVSKELPPNQHVRPEPSKTNSGSRDLAPSDASLPSISRRRQFALLSSSMADQVSYEAPIQDLTGKPYHGLFTYLLYATLVAHPDLTYDETAREVTLGLTRMSRVQTPVPSGNIEAKVFGGAEGTSDPYVAIRSIQSPKRITINAGTNFGLRSGTFLAIYSAAANKLSGEEQKLANARVVDLGSTTSIAELSDTPKRAVTTNDKVAIVTPFFGFGPYSILLSGLPAQPTTSSDKTFLARVAALVKENTLFKIAVSSDEWTIAIRRGCVVAGHLIRANENPQSCPSAYYLTGQVDSPLIGFSVGAADLQAAEQTAAAAEMYARQENIRGLDNAVSPMRGKVRIELMRVQMSQTEAGKYTTDPSTTTAVTQALNVGDNFLLRVTNDNKVIDVYAATLMLGSSGKVDLITSNPRGTLLHAGESVVITQFPRLIGPPEGLETYKTFATTSPDVDYRVFEQPGATKAVISSAFGWVLNQTINSHTRDSTVNANLSLSDWTTSSVSFDIQTPDGAHQEGVHSLSVPWMLGLGNKQ